MVGGIYVLRLSDRVQARLEEDRSMETGFRIDLDFPLNLRVRGNTFKILSGQEGHDFLYFVEYLNASKLLLNFIYNIYYITICCI